MVLAADEHAVLVAAAARETRVRRWRRFRAVLLVADGQSPETAATSVGCSRASVYNWVAAWQPRELGGITEAAHISPPPAHTTPLGGLLTERLGSDPQMHGHHATGWTVPLCTARPQGGIAVSEATVRRAVRRLGWRWKRPKYVLGRPDRSTTKKGGGSGGGRGDAGGGRRASGSATRQRCGSSHRSGRVPRADGRDGANRRWSRSAARTAVRYSTGR